MVSVTLSIPEDVKHKMDNFSEINWSGFIRSCIVKKTMELSWKDQMLKKLDSEREFDKQALEIGDNIKEGMWKKYKKEGW